MGCTLGRKNAGHNAVALHWSPNFILGAVLSKVASHQRLERPNGVSHLPRTPTRFATRICNDTGHSDVTNAHRVIPRDSVHRPCAIASPTSPRARPTQSARAGHPHRSSQPVGTVQRTFPAALHAIARSNLRTGLKKCESLFARCAQTARAARTACPLLSCRQHLLSCRKAVSAPKP